jgi:uncharacterized lipoprotein YddW (UPF0748 family)
MIAPLAVALLSLAAITHDVAVLAPGKPPRAADQSELRTARDAAASVSRMLDELGIPVDTVSDKDLLDGVLRERQVVILAYNPYLDEQTAGALSRFVQSGGKLLVCYLLPPRLAAALGFDHAEYVRQQRPGQFAEVRFDAAQLPGMPQSVRQDSWNITAARPAGYHARVIGRWYDQAGQPTRRAALLLSDRGAFFSHLILSDDRQGKKQMLAALLGHFSPPLWRQMARAEIDHAGRVGGFGDFRQAAEWVTANGDAAARRLLDAAAATLAAAREQFARGQFVAVARSAGRGHEQLAEAYLRAQPVRRREGRAVWNHSGTGAYPGDWDRSARLLAQNGFNMILPNMLWAGQAHYPSDVLPPSATFAKYGDQIEQCVAAAKKYGLEVHVWKVDFNLAGAPPEFVGQLRRQGRTQVAVNGRPLDWLCPSHPENRQLELQSLVEVVRKYRVDGLHFDYIRYPDRESCYCDGCRRRFEADSARRVADWPQDCYRGPRREEYNDWRCRQITLLVAAVRREVKRIRPEVKLSAAVFGGYPACRREVAQDWPAWIKAGYLDFVCPMDYAQSDEEFAALVREQVKLVEGRIPIYAGIGATASNSTLEADRVVGQIHYCRSLGAAGFSIFNFDHGTAATILPGVGLGVGRTPAVPPHRPEPAVR